jgi:hypothetical protein
MPGWYFTDWDPTDPIAAANGMPCPGPHAVCNPWWNEWCDRMDLARAVTPAAFDAAFWAGRSYSLVQPASARRCLRRPARLATARPGPQAIKSAARHDSTRADPESIERVNREADRLGLSLSAYIRLAVNERMERTAPDASESERRGQ